MSQIDDLRRWRDHARETHLYDTASLVGDKILALTGHPDDAYELAQSYYGAGEFLRGAHLILSNSFEQESPKCRYIACQCLIQAQELDRALSVLQPDVVEPGAPVLGRPMTGRRVSAAYPPHGTPSHIPTTARTFSHTGHSTGQAAGQAAPHSSVHTAPHAHPNHSAVHGPSIYHGLASPGGPSGLGGIGHEPGKVRVLSTSSLKPHATGARTVSGASRVSMILPSFDEEPSVDLGGEEIGGVFLEALLQFLVGRVYTMQSKFQLAKEAYIAALRIDARCYDALAQLVKFHALTPREEWDLLTSLDFSRTGNEFGQSLYALRLSALTERGPLDDAVRHLREAYMLPENNGDIVAAYANHAFDRGQFDEARAGYARVLEEDPHNLQVQTNHVSTLVELNERNELYKVSHELTEAAPHAKETWFAVGMYYLATNRIADARVQFSKAGAIDAGYAPAWLAFARTFAVEFEHDQAVTAYSTAARLFPGYYVPYVCIGMQHLQVWNLSLAAKYLATAAEAYDEDPVLINELAVVFYHQSKGKAAMNLLENALRLAEHRGSNNATVLSIKANMGFVWRRLQQPQKAHDLLAEVLAAGSADAPVLAAMGLCLLQLGRAEEACDVLARSLTLEPDDTITNDLMRRAVKTASSEFSIADFARENKAHMQPGTGRK